MTQIAVPPPISPPPVIEPTLNETEGENSDLEADSNEATSSQYVMLPPPYADNNDLPTYDEVERMKQEEEQQESDSPYASLLGNAINTSLFNGELEVGSDSTFLLTFLIALMFSWVGFMLTFCVSNSLAGRYGAISGFGLSLVKWTLIMTHSNYAAKETTYWLNAWVWWLMIVLGMTIFVRGIYMYVRAKAAGRFVNRVNGSEDGEQPPQRYSLFYFN